MTMPTRTLLASFLARLRPYRLVLTISTLCESLTHALGMMTPLFAVIIFDYAYPQRDLFLFTVLTGLGLGMYLIDIGLSAHSDYLDLYANEQLTQELMVETFEKIERLPMSHLGSGRIGDLTVRLTDDVAKTVDIVTSVVPQLAIQSLKLGIFFAVTWIYDPWIALLAIVGIPIYLWEAHFFSDRLASIEEAQQANAADVLGTIQTRLQNMRTIKAANQQQAEAQHLGRRVRRGFFLSLRESMTALSYTVANSLTIQLWTVCLTWFLGFEVIRGALTIGQVIALGTYLTLLEAPIRELALLYRDTRVGLVAMRRVATLLEEAEEPANDDQPALRVPSGHIVFDRATFGFLPEKPVIRNFSLEIRPGRAVAFVGESGSGKSTLVHLLMRFYELQHGSIRIDGQDIQQVSVQSLRDHIGVVFQEPAILDGTVRDNIVYGRTEVADADVCAAAEAACAHEFIMQLPQGYETPLDPMGETLSGGQRQRIAIARVLLLHPKILIFDEATSALDAESEFMIQTAISRLMRTHTIVIVAHRLSTIKKVDEIVVMHAGEIVERGGYNALLEQQGEFFRLYNLQYGGFQHFRECLDIEFQRYLRYNEELTFAIALIDDIERLRQQYAPKHVALLMEEIALHMRKALRVMDFCAVYGSNMVVMALPQTGSLGARAVIRRMQDDFRQHEFRIGGQSVHVHPTVGSVSCREAGVAFGEDLFERARQAILESAPEMSYCEGFEEAGDERQI